MSVVTPKNRVHELERLLDEAGAVDLEARDSDWRDRESRAYDEEVKTAVPDLAAEESE